MLTGPEVRKLWHRISSVVNSPRVAYPGAPKFVSELCATFAVDHQWILAAIRSGDPAALAAYEIRLDQLHCQILKDGGDRFALGTVTYAKYLTSVLTEAAAERLVERGGQWPPSAPATDEPPPDESSG